MFEGSIEIGFEFDKFQREQESIALIVEGHESKTSNEDEADDGHDGVGENAAFLLFGLLLAHRLELLLQTHEAAELATFRQRVRTAVLH